MPNRWDDPAFVINALYFYKKNIADKDIEDLHLNTIFEIFSKSFPLPKFGAEEFQNLLLTIDKADSLAQTLRRNVDYIINEDGQLKLFKNGQIVDAKYANGIHEFLNEIINQKLRRDLITNNAEDLASNFEDNEERSLSLR